MKSLLTVLSFVAMILAPCVVAMNTGIDSLEEEKDFGDDPRAYIPE